MKTFFICACLPFLLKSNNKTSAFLTEASDTKVISFIDNYRECDGQIYLKLAEVSGAKVFDKKLNQSAKNTLENSYKNGIPLMFNISGSKVVSIEVPQVEERSEYLNHFDVVAYHRFENLNYNRIENIEKLYRLQNGFDQFLVQQFSTLHFNDFTIGCEARAGIITLYLNQQNKLWHYKLFLKGKIIFKTPELTYCWSNHVLNVLPIEENGKLRIYLFDPFLMKELIPIENFMKQLEDNGSEAIEWRLTDHHVFVCNMQNHFGINDANGAYSTTIFKQLYQR